MNTAAKPKELAADVEEIRAEARSARRLKDERMALVLFEIADRFAKHEEYTRFMSEEEASARSGWSMSKVRRSITLAHLHTEHVEQIGRNKYRLRACIVPRRQHLEMVRADAQRVPA